MYCDITMHKLFSTNLVIFSNAINDFLKYYFVFCVFFFFFGLLFFAVCLHIGLCFCSLNQTFLNTTPLNGVVEFFAFTHVLYSQMGLFDLISSPFILMRYTFPHKINVFSNQSTHYYAWPNMEGIHSYVSQFYPQRIFMYFPVMQGCIFIFL